MTLPRVKLTKLDGQTGVVKPSVAGILAIIAPCALGAVNQPQAYTSPGTASSDKGAGPLAEIGAYVMDVSGNPVVLIRGNATTPGAYGTMTLTGTGATVPTAHSGTHPLDDYDVLITCTFGGTVGTGPVSYTYSLDGGLTTSAVQSLGTATEIAIPNTGIGVDLTAATLDTGDTISFTCTGPQMSSSDLTNALESLRTYGGPWEGVLVVNCDATAGIVGSTDTWAEGLEAVGKFRFFAMNAVKRDPNTQTEAQYATALTTAFASAASIRGFVGADVADMVSVLTGVTQPRPVAAFVAARAMAVDPAVDCAQVSDGPLNDCQITDVRGNPKYHNEEVYPGLDDLRLVTLRSFNGRNGVYCTNPNLISSAGSDYVYLQHARVANLAAENVFQTLTGLLSKGIPRDTSTGKILEGAAQEIEGLVKNGLEGVLNKRVSGFDFILSRNDNIASNAGAKLSGDIELASLAYAKEFDVNERYVRTLTRTVQAA